MSLPTSKLWIRFAFACLATVLVIAVMWWVRVNREDTPPLVVIGGDRTKPKLPRFDDIVTSMAAKTIRVDYAFLSVTRPPLKRKLPPGVSEANSHLYSWSDPVFDELQARLIKVEHGDEVAWRKSFQGFQGRFQGVTLEVVAAGSDGYSVQDGPFVRLLHVFVKPKPGDPLQAGYAGDFLLAQARGGRLVGFRNASPTCVAYTSQEMWMPVDVANKETQVMKFFETMTTYNVVVLRFSAVGSSGLAGMGGGGSFRAAPVKDKATLIKSMIEWRRQFEKKAKQPPSKPALPTLR